MRCLFFFLFFARAAPAAARELDRRHANKLLVRNSLVLQSVVSLVSLFAACQPPGFCVRRASFACRVGRRLAPPTLLPPSALVLAAVPSLQAASFPP